MLLQWSVIESKLFLILLLDSASFMRDFKEKIRLERSRFFDDKVEVEITRILYDNLWLSTFIDVNVTKVNHMDILRVQWVVIRGLLYRMMQGIPNTFDIQRDWSLLLLNITKNIIVIFCFNSRSKCNLYSYLIIRPNHSRHWWNLQGVSVFRIASDRLLIKWEVKWNVL